MALSGAFWEGSVTDPQSQKQLKTIGRTYLYHRRKRGQNGRGTEARDGPNRDGSTTVALPLARSDLAFAQSPFDRVQRLQRYQRLQCGCACNHSFETVGSARPVEDERRRNHHWGFLHDRNERDLEFVMVSPELRSTIRLHSRRSRGSIDRSKSDPETSRVTVTHRPSLTSRTTE
jgi:hypothetical protein